MSTAKINRLFLAGARDASDVEILAVGSRSASHAERFAAENGIERAYGSYEALLADPDVDVVYIPLPNSLHVEFAIRSLRAGKHVLCEKPMSRRAADVERAFDVAEAEGRLLMEAFMYRHNPQTSRLMALIAEGRIGRVRMIRAAFGFLLANPNDVRFSAALDGGALMDVGCYCVNGARLIAGEPEHVNAEQVIGGGGVDVIFAATMRLPNDVLAHFDAGLALAESDELEVVGEDGSLFLDDPWHCRVPVIELRRDGTTERVELAPVDSYRLEAENMAAAVRGEVRPLLGRSDAVGQARAIEALYRSAESGRSVAP
jgi:predicted dehydrogenase